LSSLRDILSRLVVVVVSVELDGRLLRRFSSPCISTTEPLSAVNIIDRHKGGGSDERTSNYATLSNQDEMLTSLERKIEEIKATLIDTEKRQLSLNRSFEERKATSINQGEMLLSLQNCALKRQCTAYMKTIVVAIPEVLIVEIDNKKSARAEKRSQRSGRRGLKRSSMEPADTNDMPAEAFIVKNMLGESFTDFPAG
jgi:hypothetical protein